MKFTTTLTVTTWATFGNATYIGSTICSAASEVAKASSMEPLLKGKDQYRWSPCTNYFRLANFDTENILCLCYKTNYFNEEVNCTEPFLSISVPWQVVAVVIRPEMVYLKIHFRKAESGWWAASGATTTSASTSPWSASRSCGDAGDDKRRAQPSGNGRNYFTLRQWLFFLFQLRCGKLGLPHIFLVITLSLFNIFSYNLV